MPTSSLDRLVEERLGERAVRYTRGRRAVLAALAEADGPLSAAELSRRIGSALPLSSLYRSLAVLEEAGVLAPHHATKGLTRYEIAEWLAGHHHHLVCVECGSVEDIEIPERHETNLRDLVDEVSAGASFTPSNHALEMEGRCAQCV